MTRTEYQTEVNEVLAVYTDQAAKNLREVFALLPEKTKAVEIIIFIDQDGEGFLNVDVGLVGPDLYVLNKSISDCASLFETKMTEGGLRPPLPLMDAKGGQFDVRDALTDSAANWLLKVWTKAGVTTPQVPVSIESHDQYGALLPIVLNS